MFVTYEAEFVGVKKDVEELKKDVTELKATQPFLQTMLNRNTEVNEKLISTLHEVEKSMISLNDKIDAQTQDIASIKQEMDETTSKLDDKIQNVEHKIKLVDEDGKFNIRTFFKEYFPWIIVLLGLGINFLSRNIKF